MKFIKKNWLMLIFLVLGLMFVLKVTLDINKDVKDQVTKFNNYCLTIDDNKNASPDAQSVCKEIKLGTYKYSNKDFYYKYSVIVDSNLFYLCYVFGLVLFIISLKEVSSIFKSRSSLMMLKRENYKDFLKRIFKSVYKSVWFWPLIVALVSVISLIGSDFNYDYAKLNYAMFSPLCASPIFVILSMIIHVLLFSITYLNLGLIVVRHQHNYFLAVIESFLLVIALEIFLEVVPGGIIWQLLYKITKKNLYHCLVFTIMDPFTLHYNYLGTCFIYAVGLTIITSFIVYLSYRDKEKLIIACEKNN